MCSYPYKSVKYILYLCLLHKVPVSQQVLPAGGVSQVSQEELQGLQVVQSKFRTVRRGSTLSGGGEVMGMPTNLHHRAKCPSGSAGGVPPAGANPPPSHSVRVTSRLYQIPGTHANAILYQRAP